MTRFAPSALTLSTAIGLGALGIGHCSGVLVPADRRAPLIVPVQSSLNVVSSDEADEVTLEGLYVGRDRKRLQHRLVLPLPRDTEASGVSLTLSGKACSAHLLRPEEATPVAQQFAHSRRDASFLEWFGRPLIVSDPFLFPRGERRTISLRYRAAPRVDSSLRRLTVPVAPLRSAGGERSPLVRVQVAGDEQPNLVYSPTHSVETRKQTDDTTVISLEGCPSGHEREAVLYCGSSSGALNVEALTYVPSEVEDPYFLLLIGGEEESIPAREILFVLDISGSMEGYKVAAAKRALMFCLDDLAPEDRFDLALFNRAEMLMEPRCIPCTTPAVDRAKSLVRPQDGRGLTDVEHALTKGLQVFSQDYMPKLVVVLTDGFATTGLTEDQQIIESVLKANTVRARFFTVGVGNRYNRPLLEELARLTGGHHVHVAQSGQLLNLLRDNWEQVAWGLWDLDVEAEDFEPRAVSPNPLPELVVDSPRVVVGRMRGVEGGNVTVRCNTPNGPVKAGVKLTRNSYNPVNAYIARL